PPALSEARQERRVILVDPITRYPASMCRGLPGRDWCHMVSDTSEEELHAFAARIGCQRSWFQGPPRHRAHYDLTPSRRARAVALGAVEVTSRDLVQRTYD